MKTDIHDVTELAISARRSIEPGLPSDGVGSLLSAGACLHACLVVVMLCKRFGQGVPAVRGGADRAGALDMSGRWCGHYWVEVQMPSGSTFVVDVTADQFGYEPVVVLPISQSMGRYRKGSQREVDDAFSKLASEMNCRDLVAA